MNIFKKLVATGILLSSFVILSMFSIANERNIKRHAITIKGQTGKKRQLIVFFITDIHRRKIDRQLLKKIKTKVDMVIIGGDLAEENVPLSRVARNVEQLSALGQVFYVWGNNDREIGEEAIRAVMKQYNGIIVEDDNQFIPNHTAWGICGTDDPSWKATNPEKTLLNIERYAHVLFVSHQPAVWRKIEPLYEPTLMLAGHTHGGQIRLGKYAIGDKGSFKWADGRGKLISNGYGTTKLPLRFGAHPESHLLEIHYTE